MPSRKFDRSAPGKFVLPADPKGFQDASYWDQFFSSRNAAFEWYGNFLNSAEVLCKYIKPRDDILVVGAGNSELSAQMYKVGLKKITNIDISSVVVDKMRKKYSQECPDMKFVKDDVTKLESVADESVSVVLDKATFDALVADDSSDSLQMASNICDQVARVLKFGGRYICITLAQKHLLGPLVINMTERNFAVRAHKIETDGAENNSVSDAVFCLVFTKMKAGLPIICDIQLSLADKIQRVEDAQQFIKRVQEAQYHHFIGKCLRNGRYDLVEGEIIRIFSVDRLLHKYNMYPVKPVVKKPKFGAACFVIPPGRARTYLYGTHDGRKQVADENISAHAVMFVEVMPAFGHFSFARVKDELTPEMRNLLPPKLFEKMIFITDGDFPESDDLVHSDRVLYEGTSPTTGAFRVYEKELLEPLTFERRLVFLDKPNVVQSEIQLKKEPQKDATGTEKIVFNRGFLPSDYQRHVIAALLNHPNLLQEEPAPLRVLLIGLGGGSLVSFIHENFPTSIIDAVELDPAVLDIAVRFFGLPVDERCRCHVDEGLKYMREAVARNEQYDVVIIDADTKDAKLALRCPPEEFVQEDSLKMTGKLISDEGLLIMNVVSRTSALSDRIKTDMLNIFGNVMHSPSQDDDINTVLVSCGKRYFVKDMGGPSSEEVESDSKVLAVGHFLHNLRKFNQVMNDKYGTILIDAMRWWKKMEANVTLNFMKECGLSPSDQTDGA